MKENSMKNLRTSAKHWKKGLRYLRWSSKAVFLLLFIVPIAYLIGAPQVPVISIFFATPNSPSFFYLPITQSVCSVWVGYYGNIEYPGSWILCPLGGLQALLAGRVDAFLLGPTFIAMLIFLLLIVLLGNAFCGWACPIGTLVDSFDKAIELFFPGVEAKRNERSLRRRQNMYNDNGYKHHGKYLVCPSCPISKVISNRNEVVEYGILGLAFVGSAALRFNVFCSVCPMGILTRGMLHLKAVLYIAKGVTAAAFLYVAELLIFPVAAVLVSIRERRFWCKKLCPLGALLNGAGTLNPFIKPRVKEEKCVMKGCPDECEDYHGDYCGICRLEDEKKCEKVCPMDINLVDHQPLHRCTKCMECYIVCDRNAVRVDLMGKPEVFRIGGFFRRLRGRRQKDQITPIKNPLMS